MAVFAMTVVVAVDVRSYLYNRVHLFYFCVVSCMQVIYTMF